jgi:hypothetical protein
MNPNNFEPVLYPPTFAELNLSGDMHIRPEDIADYSFPEGKRERYTEAGWEKAKQLGLSAE